MNNQRILIVGQGLAGSVLALEMLDRGFHVEVVDNHHKSSSSLIAAGMWNPIAFRRIHVTWRAKEMLNAMFAFHEKWQKRLKNTWLFQKPIVGIFTSYETYNDWSVKASQPIYSDFVANVNEKELESIKMPYGHAAVQGGYVNIPLFLTMVRNYLQSKKLFQGTTFIHENIKMVDEKAVYNGIVYDRIIFAEGYKGAANNPYFKSLPLNGTKGQVLTLKKPPHWPKYIANKRYFALPLENEIKMGATFEWDDTTTEITQQACEELSEGYKSIFKTPMPDIIDQKAGFRPTVKDRRPLVGWHPHYSQLGIFNGLGTKGVMISVGLASMFCDHLQKGVKIWPEVDINRF